VVSETEWSGLLVSVRDADEAAACVTAGAAIIDVKEPARGPLGRADAAVAVAVRSLAAGRVATTVACGELADGVDAIVRHAAEIIDGGVAGGGILGVKAGPAGTTIDRWRESYHRLATSLPAGTGPVAVAYADWWRAAAPPPEVILAAAAEAGAATLLIDTFDKSGPGLFATVTGETIALWRATAAAAGLRLALAGRLTAGDVAAGFRLGADICGVRSAVCRGGRQGRLDPARVRGLATLRSPGAGPGGEPPKGEARREVVGSSRPPSTRSGGGPSPARPGH
jgi:uncharacterized protein (UPF0264 family)